MQNAIATLLFDTKDIRVQLLGKFAVGWPQPDNRKSPTSDSLSVSLHEALTRRFTEHDVQAQEPGGGVYLVQYAPHPRGLRFKSGAENQSPPVVFMHLAIFDVDAPAHGKGIDIRSWFEAERPKISRMLVEHPGLIVYRSRAGYRIIGYLPGHEPLAGSDAVAAWTRRYKAWQGYLKRRFEIISDNVGDWTREQRVPHDTREGRVQDLEVLTPVDTISAWAPDLLEEDWPPELPKPMGLHVAGTRPTTKLGRALHAAGLVVSRKNDTSWCITCPLSHEHTTSDSKSTTILLEDHEPGSIKCLHTGCGHAERLAPDFWTAALEKHHGVKVSDLAASSAPSEVEYVEAEDPIPERVEIDPIVRIPRGGKRKAEASITVQSVPAPSSAGKKVDSIDEVPVARVVLDHIRTCRQGSAIAVHEGSYWVYEPSFGVYVEMNPKRWVEPLISDFDGRLYIEQPGQGQGVDRINWRCTKAKQASITKLLLDSVMREQDLARGHFGEPFDDAPAIAVFRDQTLVQRDDGTLAFMPNCPEHRARVFFPYTYTKGSEPQWLLRIFREDWFRGVEEGEREKRIKAIRQYMACALLGCGRAAGIDRMLVLVGHGRDGKSEIMKMISELLRHAPGAVSEVSRQKLLDKGFGGEATLNGLKNSWVNIQDELEGGKFGEVAPWKTAIRYGKIGGARDIGKSMESITPKCVWVTACNVDQMPTLEGASEATLDRLLCVFMPNSIGQHAPNKVQDLHLHVLRAEEDSLVSWLVDEAMAMVNGGQRPVEPGCHAEMLEAWRQQRFERTGGNEPHAFGAFVETCCVRVQVGGISSDEIRSSYRAWLATQDYSDFDRTRFEHISDKMLGTVMKANKIRSSRSNQVDRKRVYRLEVRRPGVPKPPSSPPSAPSDPHLGDRSPSNEDIEREAIQQEIPTTLFPETPTAPAPRAPKTHSKAASRGGDQCVFGGLLPISWQAPDIQSLQDWPTDGVVSVDLECRDEDLRENGPGFHDPNAYAVGVAIAFGSVSYYLPIRHEGGGNLPEAAVLDYLKRNIAAFRGTLVGYNLQYDLGFLKKEGLEFHPSVRFEDSMIAEVLIDETQPSYELDDTAKRRGFSGKAEKDLRDAVKLFRQPHWKSNPKACIWRLHAGYVGEYGEQDARLPLRLLEQQREEIAEQDLSEVWELECAVLPIVFQMNQKGIPINRQRLSDCRSRFERLYTEARSSASTACGLPLSHGFENLKSELEPALAACHLHPPRTPKSNEVQVTSAWLDAQDSQLCAAIRNARRFAKALQFVSQIEDQTALSGQDRVYYNLKQVAGESWSKGEDTDGVRYGRMSCKKLNLQQIPSRDPEVAALLREVFEPEQGMLMSEADFSSQEPRWIVEFAERAGVVGGKEAAEAYRKNPLLDAHARTIELTGGTLTRAHAKTMGLGKSYGMGDGKMCRGLGLPTRWAVRMPRGQNTRYFDTQQEAEDFSEAQGGSKVWETAGIEGARIIETYEHALPYIDPLIESLKQEVKDNDGCLRTYAGRRLHFPSNPGDCREPYKEMHKVLNRKVQGSAADHTKRALVALAAAGLIQYVHLPVHDSVLASVPSVEVAKQIAKRMEQSVDTRVPAVVQAKIGAHWGALEPA